MSIQVQSQTYKTVEFFDENGQQIATMNNLNLNNSNIAMCIKPGLGMSHYVTKAEIEQTIPILQRMDEDGQKTLAKFHPVRLHIQSLQILLDDWDEAVKVLSDTLISSGCCGE
jgi:uncharacterized membrane protein